FPAGSDGSVSLTKDETSPAGCPGGGKIEETRILPGRFDLRVDCPAPSTLMLKETYHPNWRGTVAGRPGRPLMVSPSFIGLDLSAGAHEIRVEYRSPVYKTVLLLLGACVLVATLVFRRWFDRLEKILS